MSIVNTERDLESLLVDIRTRDLRDADLSQIADALPTKLLVEALRDKLAPPADTEPIFAYRDHGHEEKLALLLQILRAWDRMPEQRLGQLISNAFGTKTDLFYVTNRSLVAQIEDFVKASP